MFRRSFFISLLSKIFIFRLSVVILILLTTLALESCSNQDPVISLSANSTITPSPNNNEKVVEDKDWRVVIQGSKKRQAALKAVFESYLPKNGYYFLIVQVTFERNPAFDEASNAINIKYQIGGSSYSIHETGAGNNDTYGNFRFTLLAEPNPKDPNDRPYSTELYFEVPNDAKDFQLSFGSTPPVSLGN